MNAMMNWHMNPSQHCLLGEMWLAVPGNTESFTECSGLSRNITEYHGSSRHITAWLTVPDVVVMEDQGSSRHITAWLTMPDVIICVSSDCSR